MPPRPRFTASFLSAVLADDQARLISLMMTSRITAPIKASMMAPTMPPPITNAELRQQPAGDDAADDADDDVADQAKAAAFDDHAGQPAGNRADDQPNDNAHVFPRYLPGKGRPSAHPAARQSLGLCPWPVSGMPLIAQVIVALQHKVRQTAAMLATPRRECRCIPGAHHGRCAKKTVRRAAQGSLRDRRSSAARPCAGENVCLGDPQGAPRAAGDGDAAAKWFRPGRSPRTRCWSMSWPAASTTTASGPASASRSRRSTATSIRSISPAPMRPASSGRSAPKCGAGRSATKSSSIAIRTTATTRNAMAAIRYCRRRSASGATRRRTARSRNSAACSRAN